MIFVIFFAVAFGISLLAAHIAYELADRFQTHWALHKEARDRIQRDLKYRKIL